MVRHKNTVVRAMGLMSDDLASCWTIARLASACNTSPSVLKEAFRTEMGVSVYAWYRQARMDRACDLMSAEPEKPIAQIAAEVGYSNPSKFSKAFRVCQGCSPSEWRMRKT